MSDPFQILSAEVKLLAEIHASVPERFKAKDLIKRIQPALREYFGDRRDINPVRVGILLKRLLGEHDTLRLEGSYDEVQRLQMRGKYDKSLRVWSFRVIDTTGPKPAPAPPTPAPVVQTIAPPTAALVVRTTERAESVSIDSTSGHIKPGYFNVLNPYGGSDPAEGNPDISRNADGTHVRVGDRMSDGATQIGYPGGLKAGLAAMERTAQLAGARREYRAPTHHAFMCKVLGCSEDTFC
jgi:hypothetical protein